MKYRNTSLAALASSLLWMGGCATTGGIAKIDNVKKRVVLESTDDGLSAMSPAHERSDVQQSAKKLEAALKENPRNYDALINLAQLEVVRDNLKAAETYTRRALSIDLKNKDARKILAQIQIRRKNFDMAQIILSGLGGTSSKDSEIMNMLAIVAYFRGDNALALAQFKESINIDGANVAARMNLGVLFLHYRQISNAAVQFERVLKIMPDHDDAKLHLAVIYATRGNYSDAENIYDKILARDHDNPLALYNLAALEKSRKNYSVALGTIKKYLDTKYARASANKEVYRFLDEIRKSQEEAGAKVSDEEIQSLARKLDTKSKPMDTAQSTKEQSRPVAAEPPPKAVAQPAAPPAATAVEKPVEPPQAASEDDISKLEKELQ